MPVRPVKIGVLSDSHIGRAGEIPEALLQVLKGLDLIVHLGDYCAREMLDTLKQIGNFVGVAGNHDCREIKCKLPGKDILEINGKRLGLLHGDRLMFPRGIQTGLRRFFQNEKLDAILKEKLALFDIPLSKEKQSKLKGFDKRLKRERLEQIISSRSFVHAIAQARINSASSASGPSGLISNDSRSRSIMANAASRSAPSHQSRIPRWTASKSNASSKSSRLG